jgi:hypothetical protein
METPFVLNPLMQIWMIVDASQVLTHFFLKYIKSTKMVVVHVLGNVEDECCLSSLTFLKSKFEATLNPHLPLVIGMYNYKLFTLKTFPYIATFDAWNIGIDECYGIIAYIRFCVFISISFYKFMLQSNLVLFALLKP